MGVDSTQHCEQTLMFTDIVGYSRLMGRNEVLAVEMLGDYRKILLSHIEAQGGQLVEFVGDAIFARFNTAASAVAAAIAIQQHLLAFNEARDKKLPRLQTRIGLNKGDVMLRDGAVFGDAVNIAARLEPLAVADAICISQSVYDEVRFSLSAPAKRLGAQTLKNIQQKVRVYLIKPAGIGWRDHLHYFLRSLNRKIVAYRYPIAATVLALIAAGIYFIPRWLVPGYAANYVEIADFKNLLNEKGDADYFSAGITEAVRSQLADMRDVYIVDAKEGIHAPIRLEGSVQKLGDNLRIAYRLFRRKDNVQIAGGKLDGTYQDIFILQDRLVGEIARYLADEFQLQNFRPAPLRLTNDITAYDFYLKGLEYLSLPSSQGNFDGAIQNFTQALVHDNKFSLASSGLCRAYGLKYELTHLLLWLEKAEVHCLNAVEQDNNSVDALVSLGVFYRSAGKYNDAVKYLRAALVSDENNVAALVALASIYNLMQKNKESEMLYLSAIKKQPKSWDVYQEYGYYLMRSGRYEEAIKNYNTVLEITPENVAAFDNIGAAYLYMGDFGRAGEAFEMAARIEPAGRVFSNTGVMHYYAGNYDKAIDFYKKAIRLEPDNIQFLSNLADAYFFVYGLGDKTTSLYFKVKELAQSEVDKNPKSVVGYQYLALANLYFGDLSAAKSILEFAENIDQENSFSHYVKLRIAVVEKNEAEIVNCANKLKFIGYSKKLIVSDPYFAILLEERFKKVF